MLLVGEIGGDVVAAFTSDGHRGESEIPSLDAGLGTKLEGEGVLFVGLIEDAAAAGKSAFVGDVGILPGFDRVSLPLPFFLHHESAGVFKPCFAIDELGCGSAEKGDEVAMRRLSPR